ncbi:MAG TPA: MHYT domain-containing protein [Micromonosporaceae bacterium]|nr:MHYT domain-containing protein [Micromonosporaceae bacterium]
MAAVAELHHLTYGWFSPVAAYVAAFLGMLLGLVCAARARDATVRRRRIRWLVLAGAAVGGGGVWLMTFMAMLGFDVPASRVRYDPFITIASLALAVVVVCLGLLTVCLGRRRVLKVLLGGVATGLGLAVTHYTGMLGLHVGGSISYDLELVGISVLIAVVTATLTLWLSVTLRSWRPMMVAATALAAGMVGMHYIAMAALQVRLFTSPTPVEGVSPFVLIVPITLLTAAGLIATAFSALQAMTEEEFARDDFQLNRTPPRARTHAETPFELRGTIDGDALVVRRH